MAHHSDTRVGQRFHNMGEVTSTFELYDIGACNPEGSCVPKCVFQCQVRTERHVSNHKRLWRRRRAAGIHTTPYSGGCPQHVLHGHPHRV
eukprot:Skav220131  [mRNA]  locus=scaffold4510:9117:11363:+ [translate_table: standard]